jgi:hypothetical protein
MLRYEDLERDLAGAIRRIGAFLGIEVDEARVPEFVAAASFASMRARADVLAPESTSFAGWMAQGRADDVDALIDEWGADVVVCDEVDFGAMTAAERRGTAHVTVLVLPTGSFLRPELLQEIAAPRPRLVLAPFPPSLRDPAFPLPDGAQTVRPDVGPAVPTDRRDLLYVTLGTIFNTESGDLFDRLLTAVGDLDIEVVATVGRAIDPAGFGRQPDHVRIERFVPQSSLLPRCRAVVSHGGAGSVVGALAHGAPLVCIPLGADQPHNARRCEALGVGRTLDALGATPADIRAAIERVLADPSYRMKAAQLQDESAALPPPSAAVAAIEACVR